MKNTERSFICSWVACLRSDVPRFHGGASRVTTARDGLSHRRVPPLIFDFCIYFYFLIFHEFCMKVSGLSV